MLDKKSTESKSNKKKGGLRSAVIASIIPFSLMLIGVIICLTDKLLVGGAFIILGVAIMLVRIHKELAFLEGECPYCKSLVASIWYVEGITCKSCNNKLTVKNKKFHPIDKQ